MAKLPVFPTIGKVIKNTFKEIYQSFSYSALTGIIYGIFYLPILLISFGIFISFSEFANKSITMNELNVSFIGGFIMSAIWNTLIAAPITTALYSLYQNRKESYPGFKMFFSLLWKYYQSSAVISGLFSLTFVMLFTNMMIGLREQTWFFIIIGLFSFYLLIFMILMSFYFTPLIHLENGIKKTIRKAFLLVMDNTAMTIGLMLLLGLLLVLTILITPIWFLIYGAIIVYVTDFGFNAVYERYE